MFTNIFFVDNEMSSQTPAESVIVDTTEIGDFDDENGAGSEKLNMVVENIDVLIDKAGCYRPMMKMMRRVIMTRIYPT